MRVSFSRGASWLCQALLSGIVCYEVLQSLSTLRLRPSTSTLSLQNESKVVVTLFTSFATDSFREHITQLVIHNWASLRPAVQPVLFTNVGSGRIVDEARAHGWMVVRVPGVNHRGTPFVKAMFQEAYHLIDSRFYCFANGDVLFSESLVTALRSVDDFVMSQPNVSDVDYSRPFVFGRRSDLAFNDSLPNLSSIWDIAKNHSKLAHSDAEDYFITLRHGYPWDRIPDLVIGRVAVDNYLVLMARYHRMLTVDLTRTNKVLHLKQRGMTAFRPDGGYNKDILKMLHPKGLPWSQALTTRARAETVYDASKHVIVQERDGYLPFVKGHFFDKYETMGTFNDSHVRKPFFQILTKKHANTIK